MALLAVVFVAAGAALALFDRGGKSGEAERDWLVERSLSVAPRPSEAARRSELLAGTEGAVRATRSTGMSRELRARSDSPVTIRLRPRLADGRVPARVFVTVATEGEAYHSWFGSAAPDADGVASFVETFDRDWTRTCVLTVATSAGALSSAEDERLLFGSTASQAGRAVLPMVDLGAEERVVDAGDVVLAPPAHMGTLRFPVARAEPFEVTVRVDERSMLERTAFTVGNPGKKHLVQPGAAELRFSTFGPARTWSVVVPAPDDRRPFHHEGRPGDIVDVEFERRQGLEAIVDLVRHPRAARALVFGDDAPFSSQSLDRDRFLVREREAVRALALPLPNRREGKAELPLGRVTLPDRAFRIELWSLRDESGHRQLLTSRTFSIAGDLVQLTL